ncbi:anthranilate phosphoribosyltransferase [Cerasicoccus arenae]|uniref:Anthranilate phosphoribosyltransferase n=1 Tax=Cerasicoccus arenae TaxID=424488 RepID=A0A8J3DA82_9BACT|nr:anthranilate phosphoribosyltransferase [Cerasicoccus arenae]MBK1859422.1 anthranilate phosphoribosyltransferase [Cerasicoccus arenae]GHB94021.1 anthranilate phosphoribosyltransferase [Cerasicoccus arenae]
MSDAILTDLTVLATSSEGLSASDAHQAAHQLASPKVGAEAKAALLTAMNERGETSVELAAFAAAFRDLARDPGLGSMAERAIDIVGTGGDKSGSFNISTTSAFVVAAAGVTVLKHGNRSITSNCGSADLLAVLGVDLEATLPTIRHSAEELNFAFFFAPAFHPAFKEIMPVRKALAETGRRTIFNLLGPLINPARPAHQLLGVYPARWVEPVAHALDAVGLKSGLVVHCDLGEGAGMDEFSTAGVNLAAGAGRLGPDGEGVRWTGEAPLPLAKLGLEPAPMSDLKGGDLNQNLAILEKLMAGKAPKGLEDTVSLNAGAALWVAGRCSTLEEGLEVAREIMVGGALRRWLTQLREFYAG